MPGLKTPSNNLNVDIRSDMTGWDLRVPIINMYNEPQMPATSGKGIIIKKEEKNMNVNVRKVKLRKYGKGFNSNLQFLPPLKRWGTRVVS